MELSFLHVPWYTCHSHGMHGTWVHGGIGKTAVYICVPLSVADEVQSENQNRFKV